MQQNYRTIALLSHVGKVLMMVLLEKLKAQMEPHLSQEQAGFRGEQKYNTSDPDSKAYS